MADAERQLLLAAAPVVASAVANTSSTRTVTDNNHKDAVDHERRGRLYVTIWSMWVGVFFAAMDATLMATLTTTVSNHFRSFSILSWVASSYLIATAAIQPLTGRLTDIFGRKPGLLFCISLFALGNLLCGIASKAWILIGGRVVAGLGGGGLFAIQTVVVTDLVPLRDRGVWQGIANIVFGIGSSLGGPIAGAINQFIGWRYAFLIQVPFIIFSGLMVAKLVRVPPPAPSTKSRLARVDFRGAIFLIASLVVLLCALNSAGNLIPWSHPLIWTMTLLSALLLAIFVLVELKFASEPIIGVQLFLNRTVTASCLSNWFTMMAMYGLFFYAPIYYQLRGQKSSVQGTMLVFQGFGLIAGSLITGYVTKRTGRYYGLNLVMVSLFVGSCALVCTMNMHTPFWEPPVFALIFGFGYGGMFVISLLALVASVDHSKQAIVTSASYVFRSTGSALGVTLTSVVFKNKLLSALWDRFANEPNAGDIVEKLRNNFDLDLVPLGWREGVIDSAAGAINAVWLTILGLAIAASLCSLAMGEHKLHATMKRTDTS